MLLLLKLTLLVAGALFAAETRDIEFAKPNGEPLLLDVQVPEGKGPFPTVIIVHGGGWVNGNKRTYVPPLFPPLTEGGFVWFTIDYRLAPKAVFPAPLEDVLSAIRWVKAHAREYKVDPKRIALMGESAGGHLVAMAAVKATKAEQVAAVVDFYGPHDLLKRSRDRGEIGPNVTRLLGIPDKLDDAAIAKLNEVSPIRYVRKGLPAFLLIHGTADAQVPYEQSPMMCEALQKAGNRCEVFTVEGGAHGVGAWEKNAAQQEYKKKMVEWLRAALR